MISCHRGTKIDVDCALVTYLHKKMYGLIGRSNEVYYLLYTFFALLLVLQLYKLKLEGGIANMY